MNPKKILGNSSDALLLVKTAETGINKAYVPFVYMIFNLVSVIFAIPFGKLSDRMGREIMIIIGFLIYSVVYFFFGRYNNLNIFVILFIFYGIYSALTDGSQKALISDVVIKEFKAQVLACITPCWV
jgi:MFS family permease